MSIQKDVESINSSLEEVGARLRATREENNEIRARLHGVEQLVAKMDAHGHVLSSGTHSVGAMALDELREDSAFAHLKDWNVGTCRTKLSASIRAALTNEGSGASSSDGSYMPSQPERRGLVVEVQRPLRLLDVLPSRPVSSDSVEFVKITSSGDAAEQEYEGDEKASLDMDGTLVRADIVTVAGHTTASRQVLSDHAALQSAIDRVLRHKVLARLEHQLINGTGGQGKIDGLLNQASTFVPSVPVAHENIADRIGAAVTAMQASGYQPRLVIVNPLDWFQMQTTKSGTEDYLFGSPTAPAAPAVWNNSVVATPSMPQGKVLVIDTAFVTVLDREAPSVMLSNSHKDYFTRNLVAILGELRAGLEVLDEFAVMKFDIDDIEPVVS